ncbi:MAG: hypothetical protein JXB07_01905 [Anaerolineae bacterium]|nr:hypothetical protein [Anaerolineae bacterium]
MRWAVRPPLHKRFTKRSFVDKEADYVLAIKENQGHLYQDTVELFCHAQATQFCDFDRDYAKTIDKGYSRIEIRECRTISDPMGFPDLRNTAAWPDLQTLSTVDL